MDLCYIKLMLLQVSPSGSLASFLQFFSSSAAGRWLQNNWYFILGAVLVVTVGLVGHPSDFVVVMGGICKMDPGFVLGLTVELLMHYPGSSPSHYTEIHC